MFIQLKLSSDILKIRNHDAKLSPRVTARFNGAFYPKNTGLLPVRHVSASQGRWTPVVKRNGGAVFVMSGIRSQAI